MEKVKMQVNMIILNMSCRQVLWSTAFDLTVFWCTYFHNSFTSVKHAVKCELPKGSPTCRGWELPAVPLCCQGLLLFSAWNRHHTEVRSDPDRPAEFASDEESWKETLPPRCCFFSYSTTRMQELLRTTTELCRPVEGLQSRLICNYINCKNGNLFSSQMSFHFLAVPDALFSLSARAALRAELREDLCQIVSACPKRDTPCVLPEARDNTSWSASLTCWTADL